MKKINIYLTSMLALVMVGVTSCSDASDEITSYILGRNFSPVDFEAKNVSTTTARLVWTSVEHATSYNIEVFADDSLTFAGTPSQTLTSETNEIALSNLVYDTKYSARISAITANDESRTSKWSEIFFRTSAQQFLKSFKEDNIADRSVTATWDTSETGTDVTLLRALDANGNIIATKTLTAEEKEAGQATIEGLSPETTYTIKLYNGEKERGSRNVTTIADLAGAILLHPGDDIAQIITDAEADAVLALYGGTYEISPDEDGKMSAAKIEKNITIKGIYPTNQPIVKGRFEIYDGAALTVSQLVIDGKDNKTGDQTFNYKTANVNYGPLNVQDCEIKNYEKGICYGNVVGTIESVTFNNCLIHDIECSGGDFFDIRKNYIVTVSFTNSTIYNVAQERDFIRYDDGSSAYSGAKPTIIVDHCTINNVLNVSNAKRLLYVRFGGKGEGQDITWTNNIVSNTKAVFTNQSTTSTPKYADNYYFNCTNANIFAPSDAETKVYWNGDTSGKNGADPKYKNAANGDFTIGNDDVATLKVGDPRWY